jgi:hypothetical protein
MKTFSCSVCGNKIYFGNVTCLTCKSALAFDPSNRAMVAVQPTAGRDGLRIAGGGDTREVRYCGNHAHGVCNWLAASDAPNALCIACGLNRTIPNLSLVGNLDAWDKLERAKKRLVLSLLRFGLPLDATDIGKGALVFDFKQDATTGHLNGVITIDVREADSVERERQRQALGEAYRSLLGHLRHESGHFYWSLLIEGTSRLDDARALFGDERQDYAAALGRHYETGAPADWPTRYLSAYASSHPWEDWAETWAHYLHMVDAMDTAQADGMEPRAAGIRQGAAWPYAIQDVYRDVTFETLMESWIPLSIAMNNLSRSMGHPDFYPFVISEPARDKLAFVHTTIRDFRLVQRG